MKEVAPEGPAVNGRKLAFGTIDCSPLQVLDKCSSGRFPTVHLKMPFFMNIAYDRNRPEHPRQISRLQSRPLAFARMCL